MANLSSAFGVLCFQIEKEKLEKFKNIIEASQAGCEYYFDFNGENDATEVDFTGCGQWVFSTNIEMFGAWAKNNLSKEGIAFLEENEWALQFDYTDEECGNQVLQKVKAEIIHKAGQKLEKVVGTYDVYENYEYEAYNLIKLDVYEDYENYLYAEREHFFNQGYEEDLKEWFFSQLKEMKQSTDEDLCFRDYFDEFKEIDDLELLGGDPFSIKEWINKFLKEVK